MFSLITTTATCLLRISSAAVMLKLNEGRSNLAGCCKLHACCAVRTLCNPSALLACEDKWYGAGSQAGSSRQAASDLIPASYAQPSGLNGAPRVLKAAGVHACMLRSQRAILWHKICVPGCKILQCGSAGAGLHTCGECLACTTQLHLSSRLSSCEAITDRDMRCVRSRETSD